MDKMKHEHVRRSDKRWSAIEYVCMCGFMSKTYIVFEEHLKDPQKDIPLKRRLSKEIPFPTGKKYLQ